MQMPNDRRIVVFRSTLARPHAPSQGAQFVCRCFDRIDARKSRDLGRMLLRLGDERLKRSVDGRQRRRMKRHFYLQMRPQTRSWIEGAWVGKVRREILTVVAGSGHTLQRKACTLQRGQDLFAVSAALSAPLRFVRCRRHRDFEIDVFRKPLDQTPSLGQRSAARECRFHFSMIESGEDAERTHDLPILFDQGLIGAQGVGDIFNEALVEHAQNSGRFRYSQSCGAPVFVPPDCGQRGLEWFVRRCSPVPDG